MAKETGTGTGAGTGAGTGSGPGWCSPPPLRDAGMEEAKAVQLHSTLAAQEIARGGAHGGLGFTAGGGKSKKERTTSAEKSLMQSSTSSGREFATTTAAAVAAGHWDPFARPIAFKMNEVNRKVGGLYTMFVKGGTEGNTLKEPPAPAAAAVAASSSEAADGSFSWKRTIREALRAAPGGELKLKKLRKAVLAQHARAEPQCDEEEARRKFKKRLEKLDDSIVIDGKLVRLKASLKTK